MARIMTLGSKEYKEHYFFSFNRETDELVSSYAPFPYKTNYDTVMQFPTVTQFVIHELSRIDVLLEYCLLSEAQCLMIKKHIGQTEKKL